MEVDATAKGFLAVLKQIYGSDYQKYKDKGIPDLWDHLKRNMVALETVLSLIIASNSKHFFRTYTVSTSKAKLFHKQLDGHTVPFNNTTY
jgi:hypothetical protein